MTAGMVEPSSASADDDAAAIGNLVRAARLDGARSQRVFRALLAALARPGTIVDLDQPSSPVPAALVMALALADVDTTHAVIGDTADGRWSRVIAAATSSRPVPAGDADLVTALVPPTPSQVAHLRVGTPRAPERGARLALAVTALGVPPERAGALARLTGPGVDGEVALGVDGIGPGLLAALADRNAAFPAGVDAWLVSEAAVVGLPRSTSIAVEPGPGAGTQPTNDLRGGRS
ncbi:MAG: phosphonate C-P lyase system protein PhnH [Actinomycetota bacterium]|nr:phosphonate C-P lyase system protein PhnH [Actinomycetota bacterium]